MRAKTRILRGQARGNSTCLATRVLSGKLWCLRRSRSTCWHFDLGHEETKFLVWPCGWHRFVYVHFNAAMTDMKLKTTSRTESQTIQWLEACAAPGGHAEIRMCRKLCEYGAISDAIGALDLMVQQGCHVPSSVFYRVLKRCTQNKDLAFGRRVHALTIQSGYEGDAFLATHLIRLYASHGKVGEAMGVFTKVSAPDGYNWATIISAYARHGEAAEAAEAIRLYRQMCKTSIVEPDDHLYSAVLKACAAAKDVIAGMEVHARIKASSGKPDKFVQAGLVNMYVKCGRLLDARRVFNTLPDKDVVVWTSMIAGYTQQLMGQEAIDLYRSMQQEGISRPNSFTYASLLQACGSIGVEALNLGKHLHSEIEARGLEKDVVLAVSLVHMYVKCGSLQNASRLFKRLPDKDVVTWTAMIAGYAKQGKGQEALGLYESMQQEGLTPNPVTYVCLLQACACVGVGALVEGKRLHSEIEERGLQEDVALGGSLVNMYVKCGSLEDGRRLFDNLAHRNVVAWTSMIAGYVQQGRGQEALNLYSSMQQNGLSPDSVTCLCLLQACATVGVGALHQGKQLHAKIGELSLEDDVILGGGLVHMYAKCGSLSDARRVFDKLPNKNVVAWNTMIAGYAQQEMGQETLALYYGMQHAGFSPDSVTFACLLQACASMGGTGLHHGKQLHAQLRKRGLEGDAVLGGTIVSMYAKCGRVKDAREVFDKLPGWSLSACSAMIAGYVHHGKGQEALELYCRMQEVGLTPNSAAYACLLQACASVGADALHYGKQLHAQIEDQGLQEVPVLGGSVVNMYAKCGSIEDAYRFFNKLSNRNVVAWTALIAGYVQQGMSVEAFSLYRIMQKEGLSPPNSVTYVCLLQACASTGVQALHEGKQLHAQIDARGMEKDAVVGGSLVNMYVKCGSLVDARGVFDKLPYRNVVAWTAMIAGYAHQGMSREALRLYRGLQQEGLTPNSVTYVCLLQACASVGEGALSEGQHLHGQIKEQGLDEDIILGASLVNMYAKCGSLDDARRIFESLSERDVVTWTTMIAAYAQQGMAQEALSLYGSMQQEGLLPNSVTYVCLLQACAALAVLPLGEQLHAEIDGRGMQGNGNVGAALVNMYAKCGSMCESQRVFDSLSERSMEAWSALISGYARQGDSEAVFDLLIRMRLNGINPDHITFLSVLTVCSHAGLVEKGQEYFQLMRTDYGICATLEHYICMVDLLGRAGQLQEALDTVTSMPFPPNDVVWHTLLGACWKWKNVEIGRQAFEGAISLDERDAAAHVLMSNIYASTQMWEAAKDTKARRMKLGAWKKPGQSWWTDMEGVVHTFLTGDKTHPESESTYCRLESSTPKLHKERYLPHLASSLLDVPDEKKQVGLCEHSDKLAVAQNKPSVQQHMFGRSVPNLPDASVSTVAEPLHPLPPAHTSKS